MVKTFSLNGQPLDLTITKMVDAGYTGADQATVRAHTDELAQIGISVPGSIPAYYPMPMMNLTSAREIEVGHHRTSAEIEYVFIVSGGREYLTVGSDHSDRALEIYSITASKQASPNVIADEVWDFATVEDHLDRLRMLSEVFEDGLWHVYQDGWVSDLLPPKEIIRLGRPVISTSTDGLVLFSGTIPHEGKVVFGNRWRITMSDTFLDRHISFEYRVTQLPRCMD